MWWVWDWWWACWTIRPRARIRLVCLNGRRIEE